MARRSTYTKRGNSMIRTVSLKSILSAAAFVKGFGHVRKGKPFEEIVEINKQWAYERGRLFGCIYNGQLKNGRNVLSAAIYAYAEASRDKIVL